LTESQLLEFPEGATPTEENYRSWNVASDGILITFDPYQIAPYAVGQQSVMVPYTVLKDVIQNDSPITRFNP
jgi:hypothetical protein